MDFDLGRQPAASRSENLLPSIKSLFESYGASIEVLDPDEHYGLWRWSHLIAAAMWYLKSSIPRFSISDSGRAWIEAGLEKEYPELVKKIREEMKGR